MKSLSEVRKALPGSEIPRSNASQLLGGWAPYKPLIRNAYPYIIDTDKP